jgi:hypothetical protein
VRENRQRDQKRDCGEQADGEIHISDRAHAGNGGEDNDEGRDDLLAVTRGDRGEDEVEDIAATDELVAGNRGVGEEDSDDAEDAGSLVVTGLEQIGDCELGELSRTRSNEVDEKKAGPTARRLPEGGKAVLISVFRSRKKRAGADP